MVQLYHFVIPYLEKIDEQTVSNILLFIFRPLYITFAYSHKKLFANGSTSIVARDNVTSQNCAHNWTSYKLAM